MISNAPKKTAGFERPQEINIYDYISVIIRRRKTFVIVFLAVFITVLINTLQMKPVYEAFATLYVKEEMGGRGGVLGELAPSISRSIKAEIEILKSRTLAEQVVKKLHMDWAISEKSKELKFNILEFTSTAKEPFYKIELAGADEFKVLDHKDRVIGNGKSGALFKNNQINLLLNDISGEMGNSFKLSLLPRDRVADGLRGGIQAVEVGQYTNVLRISYYSTDPELARDVVNTLLQSYLEQSVAYKSEEASRVAQFVEEQLDNLRKELDISEGKLQEYKSLTGVMKLDSEAEKLIDIISEKERAKAELEVQKQKLLAEYTEVHPAVKSIIKQQEAIQRQLALYESKIQSLPLKERNLAALTRVSKVGSDSYVFLLQKREEANIAKASTISNVNIIDPALTPSWPVKPDKRKNILLGFLAAMGLGIVLCFFQEYLDDTIKTADEAKRIMGMPLLAVIPKITGSAQESNIPKDIDLIVQREPNSVVSEAFRALRTSLHFSGISKENKIMLVTSAFPQEGKSVISSNLACIFSQTGARVLIVDCDLRRSSLHLKFGHSKNPGLSEILRGDVSVKNAVHNTGIEGLHLITAGINPPNPSELLGSEPMRQFLLNQREKYDYIVIDAPPVLAVSDAPVLTAVSDLVILVMEAGRVPIKIAQRMREILTSSKASVAGLVINDKTGKGESYDYYSGRYHRYGNGYRYGYQYGYGYYSEENGNNANGPSSFLQKIFFWQKSSWWKKIVSLVKRIEKK